MYNYGTWKINTSTYQPATLAIPASASRSLSALSAARVHQSGPRRPPQIACLRRQRPAWAAWTLRAQRPGETRGPSQDKRLLKIVSPKPLVSPYPDLGHFGLPNLGKQLANRKSPVTSEWLLPPPRQAQNNQCLIAIFQFKSASSLNGFFLLASKLTRSNQFISEANYNPTFISFTLNEAIVNHLKVYHNLVIINHQFIWMVYDIALLTTSP